MNDCLNEIKESKSTDEKIDYLNKYVLIKQSRFGNPYLNHSFTSRKSIEHILLFIFQFKYLSQADITSLLSFKPTFKSFNNIYQYPKINFNSLLANEERHIK